MKIKTITCHDVYNYGASLQAFALQEYLREQGHDVEIIDYKPDYLESKYRFSWYVPERSEYYKKCKNNTLYHFLYVLRRYIIQHKTISRKLSFDTFTKKYLKLTRKYTSYLELCREAPEADAYIVGSDQVWNNDPLNNGWDAAFFLQFGNDGIRRLSYAASLGSTKTCPDLMCHWIESLDGISVREQNALPLLSRISKPIETVCDPVFLLDAEEWKISLKLKSKESGYILVYNLSGDNQRMIDDANLIARELGLKIHYLSVSKSMNGVINIKGAGPVRFLEEIANASYVLSDSFHATAFSIIFNKKFLTYCFKNKKASLRMSNLLEIVGLSKLYEVQNVSDVMTMDKKEVTVGLDKIRDYISHSKIWLIDQLS